MIKSIEEVTTRATEYENYYSELHEQQKKGDEFYELTFDAGVPEDYRTITPPTARDWVDTGVRTFTLDNPVARMRPRGTEEQDRKKDADCEALLDFWLSKEIIAIKRNARKLLIRGEAFIKLWFDDTYYGTDVPKEDEDGRLFLFPIILSTPDPINTFASPAHNGLVPVDVIEKFELTVSEARNICRRNGWKWDTNANNTALVKWISYIDGDVRCFLIDGVPVLPDEVQVNILGFCNYVHIDAGVGQTSWQGKPEYLYRSITYPRQDTLKAETRTLSQNDAICARYAWPKLVVDGNQEDVDKLYGGRKIDMNPNNVIRTNEQVKVTIMEGVQPPPGMFQYLSLISSMAQCPVVMGGNNPTGVYSGEQVESLIAQGKSIYKDPFKNMEEGLAVSCGMALKMIDKILEYPVMVKDFSDREAKGYRKVGPQSIDGHYDCEVKLLAESPEATMARKRLGDDEQKSGIISHRTNLIEYHDMSQDEATKEMGQVMAEKAIENNPQIQGAMGLAAIENFGIESAKEAIAANGMEVPNVPPRRTPEQMPTGSDFMPQGVSQAGMEQIPTAAEVNSEHIPMG